jgi:hypothetical protein
MNRPYNDRVLVVLCTAVIATLTTGCSHSGDATASDTLAAPADGSAAPASGSGDVPYFSQPFVTKSAPSAASATGEIADLDWTDLQPKNDPNKGYISTKPIDHTGNTRMPQVGSFNTVQALDGKHVRLPGYVVPLQTDDSGRMSEFFFVPFYGACIHVPPPPPNQMLFAKMARPIKTPDIYTAMSIVGTLRTSKHDDALASAAYSINDASLSIYQDANGN